MQVGTDLVTKSLTIVVCSSPVPSNPQTHTLQEIFASLKVVPELNGCPKILHFDGPQPLLTEARLQAYAEFKRRARVLVASRMEPAFYGTRVFSSRTFLFAAHNLIAAISHVNTTFLFSLQHDYSLARRFDVVGLLQTMLTVPVVRHVRLNMRPNAPARGFDGVIDNATLPGLRVPLTRTCGWSDAPHIASTEYYRKFVIPQNLRDHNHGRRKFMEESVHYPMQRNGIKGGCWETKQHVKRGVRPIPWPADFDAYGTYLYGVASPYDGNYVVHRSLRGNAPQWGLGEHVWRARRRGERSRARSRGPGLPSHGTDTNSGEGQRSRPGISVDRGLGAIEKKPVR